MTYTTVNTVPNTVNVTVNGAGGGGAIGSSTVNNTGNGYVSRYGTVHIVPGTSPGGGVGHYTTGITQPNYHTNIHISGPNPVLTTDQGKIDLNELVEIIKIMRERLLVLVPNFEKHEKYEALKKAYDHYKLIEAIVMGKENEQR